MQQKSYDMSEVDKVHVHNPQQEADIHPHDPCMCMYAHLLLLQLALYSVQLGQLLHQGLVLVASYVLQGHWVGTKDQNQGEGRGRLGDQCNKLKMTANVRLQ